MSALHTRLAPMLGLPLGATDDAIVEAVRRLTERACPFCGGPASVERADHGERVVECDDTECWARGPKRDYPDEAVLAWNKAAQR